MIITCYDLLYSRARKGQIMTPEEFRKGLSKLDWKQSDFALEAGITPVSVSNWLTGVAPLPVWAQRHLQLLLTLHDLAATLLEPPTKKAREARLEAASLAKNDTKGTRH